MTTKAKILIISGSIIALSATLFFTRNLWMGKKKEEEKVIDEVVEPINTGGGGTNTNTGGSNPLTNSTDIKNFQKFANSKGYSPKLAEDGEWGSKTNVAWVKFGVEYKKPTNGTAGTGKGIYSIGSGVSINLATTGSTTANPVVQGSLVRKTAKANEYLGEFSGYFDIYGGTYIGFKDVNSGRNVLIIKSGATIK